MSYNLHKRAALDETRPILHRMSHARSCTVLISQKHGVHRSEVIAEVQRRTGLDLMRPLTSSEVHSALECLEQLRGVWSHSDS